MKTQSKRCCIYFSLLFSLLFSPFVVADVIEDLSLKHYQIGWFPNFFREKGPLTCPQTCRYWTQGQTRAEGEQTHQYTDEFKMTYVCKWTEDEAIIEEPINDPKSHWMYGNQFDNKTACFVGAPWHQVIDSDHYMCLCVRPCYQLPDLIVSKIGKPIYDASTGESVIKVAFSNVGTAASVATQGKLTDSGTSDVQAIPAMGAGAVAAVVFRLPFWVYNPDANILVVADSPNLVKECNERNNWKRFFDKG